jgi:hypothetical protein
LADQGPETPYRNRLKVTLDVNEDETLGSVIDRAAENFGIGWTQGDAKISEIITGVVFYKPEDEERVDRPQPWPDSIRLVDADGQPAWAAPWYAATYADLLAAADAGLIDGDPLRPYLWPVFPQGDVTGVMLEPLLWLLERNYEFILKSAAGGAIAGTSGIAVRNAWERLKRSRETRSSGETGAWRKRLERPDDFLPILERRPQTTEQVASLFNSSGDEAEAVMWGLGFAFDEATGVWRLGADEGAALLHQELETARRSGEAPKDLRHEAIQEEFRHSDEGERKG